MLDLPWSSVESVDLGKVGMAGSSGTNRTLGGLLTCDTLAMMKDLMALADDSLQTYLSVRIATASRRSVSRSLSEDTVCFTGGLAVSW